MIEAKNIEYGDIESEGHSVFYTEVLHNDEEIGAKREYFHGVHTDTTYQFCTTQEQLGQYREVLSWSETESKGFVYVHFGSLEAFIDGWNKLFAEPLPDMQISLF